MPFNPNVPSTSLGNWMRTGSATYVPPEMTRVGRRDAQIAKLEADLAKEKEKTDSARAIARAEREKRKAEREKRGASTDNKKVDAPSGEKDVDAPKEEENVRFAKETKVDATKEKKNMVDAATSPDRSEDTKKSSLDAWKKEREGLQDRLSQLRSNGKKAATTMAADAEAEKEEVADDAASEAPEEAAKKKAEEEAVAKKEADKAEAAKKKAADEEEAKKKAEEETVAKKEADKAKASKKKAANEEKAKKKTEEETVAKKEADKAEAAKKKAADEEAAKKKAADEEEAKKNAVDEEEAKKNAIDEEEPKKNAIDEEEPKKKRLADAIAAVQETKERTVVKKGRYCCDCGQRNHEGDCDESAATSANNRSVTNNNYYILSKAQELAKSITKSPKVTNKAEFEAKALDEFKASPRDRVKFTMEQDAKLLSLKKAGKDAREVSRELGMSKLDIVDRWRELSIMKSRKAQDEAFANESVLPEGDEVIGEATDVKVKDGVATLTFKMYDTAADEIDGGNKDKKQKKASNYKKPTFEDDKDEPTGNFKNNADAKKKSNGSVDLPVYSTCTGQPTSYVPVSYASTVPLRGAACRLYPDENFSIKDLEILKEIECRYRELQWHEVAAKFYNKTGRMMDPKVIKAKISGGKEVQKDSNQPDVLNVRVNLN